MKIEYKLIDTSFEKMNLYKLRKQVFVDEENRFKSEKDYITDQFDSFDETLNFGAFVDDDIIAAVRVTMEDQSGLPVDSKWDFKEFKQIFFNWKKGIDYHDFFLVLVIFLKKIFKKYLNLFWIDPHWLQESSYNFLHKIINRRVALLLNKIHKIVRLFYNE